MCKKFFHHVKIMDFGRFFWRIWWRHSKHDELWQNFLPPKETSDPLQQSFKRKTEFEKQWLLAPASKTEWFNFWTISLGVRTVPWRTVLQRLFPDGQIPKGQFPEQDNSLKRYFSNGQFPKWHFPKWTFPWNELS